MEDGKLKKGDRSTRVTREPGWEDYWTNVHQEAA